jgi:LmbE family N-acetylglucosaminyl deacetylase
MSHSSTLGNIRSVLAVEAHPDDVEISCSGTLLGLQADGCRISIVSVSDGRGGATHDPSLTGAEIAAIRSREASSAAHVLGAEYHNLGAEDGFLSDTKDLRVRLAELIHEAQAEIILAPPPTDYHADHVATSELAFSAAYYAWTQYGAAAQRTASADDNAESGSALKRMPSLYYYDSVTGLDFVPSFFVDISPHFEAKERLVAMHASQMENMKAIMGWDLVEQIQIVARYRGLQAGTKYAEAFQTCLRWPRAGALERFPS